MYSLIYKKRKSIPEFLCMYPVKGALSNEYDNINNTEVRLLVNTNNDE